MNMTTSLKARQSVPFHPIVSSTTFCFLFLVFTVGHFSGCALFDYERSVYDREGIRIGLEADPSVGRSQRADLNNHPIDLAPKDFESLLRDIQVTGYSGTIVGLVTRPQPVSLFTPKELSAISAHLASAFREAKPTERVFFSLPKPDVVYSEDRTVGALFFRGPYLHVVLTDHSSLTRTDPGGGEARDIRDTMGMRLWVAGPAQAAQIPDLEQPRWAHFERVHIALGVKQVLARAGKDPVQPLRRVGTELSGSLPTAAPSESHRGSTSPEELERQIRDLSSTNEELRRRLDEQNRRMQRLQDQVEQLRHELPQSAP